MMRGLSAISDTAFDMLIPSYDNVLNELEVRKEAWDEAERKALKEDESKQEDHDEEVEMEAVKTNPYKTLIWTTGRLVTSVTGHRLQLGEV